MALTPAQRARAAANRARALRFLHHKKSLRSLNAIRYLQAKRRGTLTRRKIPQYVAQAYGRQLRRRETSGRFKRKFRAPNQYKARRPMLSSVIAPRPAWRIR